MANFTSVPVNLKKFLIKLKWMKFYIFSHIIALLFSKPYHWSIPPAILQIDLHNPHKSFLRFYYTIRFLFCQYRF